jgi:3-oxocholest-4-en-26-oate---CoA ligase
VSQWNFADVYERIAEEFPARPAVTQGDRTVNWQAFSERADGVADGLLAMGLGRQAKVAQYLYNSVEYLESTFACFKAGLVPVNTNYRYGPGELRYLWEMADVEAVVFHASFASTIEQTREELGDVRGWIWVKESEADECPPWATPYDALAGQSVSGPVRPSWGRSPDDIFMLCTGGTTGMPKGVLWRQDDLFLVLNQTSDPRYEEHGDLDHVIDALRSARRPPATLLPAPPLMHGSGLCTALGVLATGGCIAVLSERHFSAEELLDVVEKQRATVVVIVGDVFAKPIISALEQHPGRWDLSSLWLVISSGAMWSSTVRARLMELVPGLRCLDSLGSSEALGMASSVSSSDAGSTDTAAFVIGPNTQVLGDDGRPLQPGSGEIGLLALKGRGPIGYYKDPAKTEATFRVIDGVRWTVPGDFASVELDGSLRLLGRGSGCINTGGEKVFPEEVEEVLKLHPTVHDAACVGIPDERFGEAVTAIVEPRTNATATAAELIDFVKAHLAGYKAPKRVLFVASVGRAPNGKLDYRRLKDDALAQLAAAST